MEIQVKKETKNGDMYTGCPISVACNDTMYGIFGHLVKAPRLLKENNLCFSIAQF